MGRIRQAVLRGAAAPTSWRNSDCGELNGPERHQGSVASRALLSAPSGSAIESPELEHLVGILDPHVHVAIWRRPIDGRIVQLLQHAESAFGGRSHRVARIAEAGFAAHVAELVPAAARRVDPHGAAALAADAVAVCELFAELVAADELLVSFEEPDSRTCPRFHVDRVGIRLLVTYLGPGTEWLADEHVDRSWLGDAGHGRLDEETGVMLPGAEIRQAPPFAVVLLKGQAWPGAQGRGAVHRSPDPAGRRRVLLRVDMLSQCVEPCLSGGR